MTLELSGVTFKYDFFTTNMPDGSLLILNSVNEDFITPNGTEAVVKQINIVIKPVNSDTNILCSSIIGIGNDYLMLKSDYKEQLGKTLTLDNMKYCTLELYE